MELKFKFDNCAQPVGRYGDYYKWKVFMDEPEGKLIKVKGYFDMTVLNPELKVVVRGAGEVATGIAYQLHKNHFKICMTEIENPLAICRGTAFCDAVFENTKTIMSVTAVKVPPLAEEIYRVWENNDIAVVVDPAASIKDTLRPQVFIDATMAKRNLGTKITDAPLVIGVGPGFYAGRDVHIVIETKKSDDLGKLIYRGAAAENDGKPDRGKLIIDPSTLKPGMPIIKKFEEKFVFWAPYEGKFISDKIIGETVEAGSCIGYIGDLAITTPLQGIVRGLLKSGLKVNKGEKLIEIEQTKDDYTIIRDKMMIIGEAVVKAIKTRYRKLPLEQ